MSVISGSPAFTPALPRPKLAQKDLRAIRVGMFLLAVAILNTFDLIYTLLAYRMGMLNEVNPLAQVFLQQGLTVSLIAFKILMVFCGLGMIWKLRNSRLAIPACWILLAAYTGLSILWYTWVQMITSNVETRLTSSLP